MKLPAAIADNLVVQELQGETLIYNLTNHKAYVLNDTSSIVFNACGECQTFEYLKTKYKFTDDLIYLALDELRSENLLVGYESNHFGELSRRAVIKKVGLATMIALPLITGLVAPKAVNAASSSSGDECAPYQSGNVCVPDYDVYCCTFDNYKQSNCCSADYRCFRQTLQSANCAECCRGDDPGCYGARMTGVITRQACEQYCASHPVTANFCCNPASPLRVEYDGFECSCMCT